MWNTILDMLTTGVTSAFNWFGRILDAAPGAWSTILTLFTILVICRFLLAPVLGVTFGGAGSDRAKKEKDDNDG